MKAENIVWYRGRDRFNFDAPNVFFVMGIRGSGKSSVLENIGQEYLAHGARVNSHVRKHEGEIRVGGECRMCRRAGSQYSKTPAKPQ